MIKELCKVVDLKLIVILYKVVERFHVLKKGGKKGVKETIAITIFICFF